MKQLVHKSIKTLRQLLGKCRDKLQLWFAPPYATRIVEEALPQQLRRKTLYIVQEDGFEEQAALLCPCGCGKILHLNLLPDERPCWTVTHHGNGTSTLHPSVWRQKGCASHFWFREGRIFWCRAEAL
jgi:hypothetical protein